jgi:regulatory protein YycI of two-component signal transduction system YycFG
VDGQSRTLLANSTTTAIFAVLFVLLTILSIWLYLEKRKLTKQLNREYNSRMEPLQQQQQQSDESERTRLNAQTRITQ